MNSTINKKTNKLLTALLVVEAALLPGITHALPAGEPSTLPLGNGYLTPSVTFQLAYDDNIFLEESDPTGSMLSVISPRLRWDGAGEVSEVGFTLEADHGSYHNSHPDDYLDWRTLAEVAYFPDERITLYGSAKFNHEHDERGQTNRSVSATPDEYDLWELKGQFKYGLDEVGAPRLEIGYRHDDREYTNNRAITVGADRQTDELKGTLFYKVMPATSLLLEATATRLDYDIGSIDSDELRLLAGLTWEATYQTTGFLKLGWGRKDFDVDAGNNRDDNAFSWEIGVAWQPLSYSKFSLISNQSFEESDGVGSHKDSSKIALVWQHAWQDYFETDMRLSQTNDDYINGFRQDDVTTFEIKADYRMNPWLVFGANYKFEQRDSDVAGLDYDNNVIGLHVGINM